MNSFLQFKYRKLNDAKVISAILQFTKYNYCLLKPAHFHPTNVYSQLHCRVNSYYDANRGIINHTLKNRVQYVAV